MEKFGKSGSRTEQLEEFPRALGVREQFISINQEELEAFIDKAVEKRMKEKSKIVYIKQVSYEVAKKMISNFLKDRKGEEIWPDELAEKLQLDFKLTMKVLDELEKAKKIEVLK